MGCGVQGAGLRVQGSGCRVQSSGLRVRSGGQEDLEPNGRSEDGDYRGVARDEVPVERGTNKTVKARFWPWLSGKSPQNL